MNVPQSTQRHFGVSLSDLVDTRPELTSAPKIWSDVLAPELAKREGVRRETLRLAWRNTLIGGVLSACVIILYVVLTGGFGSVAMIALFAITALIMAAASGLDWLKVFSMKTATKDLILGAACAPFGFTYKTLHPDVSDVHTVSDMLGMARQYASGTATPESDSDGQINTPIGPISVSYGQASGPACPTPAYDILNEAKLLPTHQKRKFEDLIEGARAGAQFSLVEAKLETTGKHGKVVFQGLLLNIEYPERFLGRTLIARTGWWKRGKAARDLQKVELVSSELAKAFTIYSTDQVEARALLSPDRMERLLALEQHFSAGKIRGVFEDGHMTLAMEAPDQFEAGSIFEPLVDVRRFVTALAELGQVCDLIDGYLTRDWIAARRH